MSSVLNLHLSGNDPPFIQYLKKQKNFSRIKFHQHEILPHLRYVLELINVDLDLTNQSQKIISLYQKCRENNQKLVVWLLFSQNINQEKVHYYQNLLQSLSLPQPIHRLVVTKDLYQTESSPVTPFDHQLNQILSRGVINISSKGQNALYPTHISDFFEALIKIFLLDSTKGQTYYLLGDKTTDLDFAYLIKKTLIDDFTNIQINSNQPNSLINPEVDNNANTSQINLNWRPDTNFEMALKTIYRLDLNELETEESVINKNNTFIEKIKRLKFIFPKRKKNRPSKIDQSDKNLIKKQTEGDFFKFIFIGLIGYLLVISLFLSSLLLSYRSLSTSISSLQEGTINASVKHFQKSQTYHQVAQTLYPTIQPLLFIGGSKLNNQVHNLFVLENYLQDVLSNTQQAYVLADKLYTSFVSKDQIISLKDQTLALKTSLSQIYSHLQQLDLLLKTGDLPQSVLSQIKKNPMYSQLDQLQHQIIQVENLLDVVASVETGESEKSVLILVLDQDELRGSGGVIRYLISLKLSQNHLKEATVYSQKELDVLNAGSLKAPDIVKEFTGSEYWKLKDMSYLADFPRTATALSWYFEKITQQKPSLVVGINKSFYEKILALDIQNQQIKTTPQASLKTPVGENFNESLVEIINHYLTQYQNQSLKLSSFVQVLVDEINHGNFQIYSSDPDLQTSLVSQTYSSAPYIHQCHSALSQYSNCVFQTTYLNESNFTAAPVNHLVTRQVIHQVNLKPNQIFHDYQIKYHFLSDLSLLNRDYRLYYQLYLPPDASLSAVLVDNQPQNSNFWHLEKVNSFNLYTLALNLTVNQDHQVNLQFVSPASLNPDLNQTAYSLTEIRQSGLNDLGYGLVLNLPDNTHAKLVTAPVETKPQQVMYRFPPQTSTFGVGLGYDR